MSAQQRRYFQQDKLDHAFHLVDSLMRTRRDLGGDFPPPSYTTQMDVAHMVKQLNELLDEWDYVAPGEKAA